MFTLILSLYSTLVLGAQSTGSPIPFRSFNVEMNAELYGPVKDNVLVVASKDDKGGVRKYWRFDADGKEVGSMSLPASERPIGVDYKGELVFYTQERFSSSSIPGSPSSVVSVEGKYSIWSWDHKELAVCGPGYMWRVPVNYFVGVVDISKSGKTMVVGEDVDYDVDGTDRSVLHVLSLVDKKERVLKLKLGTTRLERVTDDVRFVNETHVAMLVRPTKEGSLGATIVPHISADDSDVQGWVVERAWLAMFELGTGVVTFIASVDVLEYKDIGGYPSNLLAAFQSPQSLVALRCGKRVWLVPTALPAKTVLY